MIRRADSISASRRASACAYPRTGRIADADLAEHEAMLLDAARRLFYEHGYEGTSIETVARTAHVSPKTIYARFGGKDGLFAAAMRERADIILAALQQPISSGDDVRASLLTFGKRLLTTTSQDEALTFHRIVIAESLRFPELAEAFYEAGPKRGIATLTEFLRRATQAGALEVDHPALAAEFFAGALLGVPLRQALLVHRRPSPRAIAKRTTEIVDAFMRAYAPR